MNLIIPMAGKGSRFPKEWYPPKPIIKIDGVPMFQAAVDSIGIPAKLTFVISADLDYDLKGEIFKVYSDANVVEVSPTDGPATTAFLARKWIPEDENLIVTNCDQIMEWDAFKFLMVAQVYDACIVTYYTDTEKNSYARIDEHERVIEVREKEVISNISLNGIHYWNQAKDFFESYEKMVEADDRAPNGEFYVSQTFNHLPEKRIGIHHIPNECHNAVGTPEDLEGFIHKKNLKGGFRENS